MDFFPVMKKIGRIMIILDITECHKLKKVRIIPNSLRGGKNYGICFLLLFRFGIFVYSYFRD